MPKYLIHDTKTNLTYLTIFDLLFPSGVRVLPPSLPMQDPETSLKRAFFTVPGFPEEVRAYPNSWSDPHIETHVQKTILESLKDEVYSPRFEHFYLTKNPPLGDNNA